MTSYAQQKMMVRRGRLLSLHLTRRIISRSFRTIEGGPYTRRSAAACASSLTFRSSLYFCRRQANSVFSLLTNNGAHPPGSCSAVKGFYLPSQRLVLISSQNAQ